jgi:hypothetical protein
VKGIYPSMRNSFHERNQGICVSKVESTLNTDPSAFRSGKAGASNQSGKNIHQQDQCDFYTWANPLPFSRIQQFVSLSCS